MEKRLYPKPVIKKKAIQGAFWTGFALVFLLSVVAVVRAGNAAGNDRRQPSTVRQSSNLAAGPGGQTFARDFAGEYFNWENTDQAKQQRADRLSGYLAAGLDPQAGLSFDGIEWNSQSVSSQVWNVKETGGDTALITLQVRYRLTKTVPPDPNAVSQAAANNQPPPQPQTVAGGEVQKYLAVPVKTDGQSFVVYQIPYFAAPPSRPKITANTTDGEGKINDTGLQQQVTTFLQTFFNVYTGGTPQELSYYVKGAELQPMKGVITFRKIQDNTVSIFKGSGSGNYRVEASVAFQEDQSKAAVVYPYRLVLSKEEGHWFIKSIENQ